MSAILRSWLFILWASLKKCKQKNKVIGILKRKLNSFEIGQTGV